MKASMFNLSIKYNSLEILYNSFSGKFITISPLLFSLYESAKHHNNFTELLSYQPLFYFKLIENGFIIEENINEIEKVKRRVTDVDQNETKYHLTINPTMNCNFKCWYCYESHLKESRMDVSTINKINLFISKKVNDNPKIKTFHISWFGGEPFLYYDKVIMPILNYASNILKKQDIVLTTGFTTNGFLINTSIIKSLKYFNVDSFQITLDGDRENHNNIRFVSANRGSYDKIFQNVVNLCQNKFNVYLRINYTKENIDSLKGIIDDLTIVKKSINKHLTVAFHKVWQEKELFFDQINNYITLLRNMGINSIDGDAPDNTLNSCYADKKNQSTINYDGNIFKCTARNFSDILKEGELNSEGEIIWNKNHKERISYKFKNSPCLSCPILPICNGGCSQEAIEHIDTDYCIYGFDENTKKQIVFQKIQNEHPLKNIEAILGEVYNEI